MTDIELLKAAAKAAGFDQLTPHDFAIYWNPLADDGLALRLAVKLRMAMYPPEAEGDGATISLPGSDAPWITEELERDPYAAMRRAIVRAAAAIGEQMK